MNRLRKAYQRGVPDARKAKARMELSDEEESFRPTAKASARPSMSPRDSLSPLDGGLATKGHTSVAHGRNHGGSYAQAGRPATVPSATTTRPTNDTKSRNDDARHSGVASSRNGAPNGNTAGTLNRNTAGGDPALSDAALLLLAQRSQDVLDRLASSPDRPASMLPPPPQQSAPSLLPNPSARQDAQQSRRQQQQPAVTSPTTITASTTTMPPSHIHNQSRNKELPPPPPPPAAASGPEPRKPLSGGSSTNVMPALVVNTNNTAPLPPAAPAAAATDSSSISSTDTTSSDILERCRDTRPDSLSLSNLTYGRTTSPTKEVRRLIHDARRGEPADKPSVVQIPQDRRAEWKIPPTPTTPWVVQQPTPASTGGPVQHGRVRVPPSEMGNQHSSHARPAPTTSEQRGVAAESNATRGDGSAWRRAARPNGRNGPANLLKKAQGGPEHSVNHRLRGDGENRVPGPLPPQQLQRNSASRPGAPSVGVERPKQSSSAPVQDQLRRSANSSGQFVTRPGLEAIKAAAQDGPNRAWSASSTIRPPVVAGIAPTRSQNINGTVDSLPSERQSSSEEDLAGVPLPSIPAPSPLPEDSPHKYGLRDHVDTPEPPPQAAQDRTASRAARRRSSGLEIFNEAKTLQSASSFLNGLSTARRHVESTTAAPSRSTTDLPLKDSSYESLVARPPRLTNRSPANLPLQRRSLTPTTPPPTIPTQRPLSWGFKPSGFSYSRPLTRVQWACYRGHARMLPSGDNRHAPVECGVCAEEHVGVSHFSCSWCALRMCAPCHRAVLQKGMQAVWERCAAVSEEQERERAQAKSKLVGTSDDEDSVDIEGKEGAAVGVKDGWNSSVDSGVGITAAEAAAAATATAVAA